MLRSAKLHLNKSHDFWNNVLWKDKTTLDKFGLKTKCRSSAQTSLFHVAGMVLQGRSFGLVLEPLESWSILQSYLKLFKAKLCQNWVVQWDSDPRNTIKATRDWLEKKRKLLQWSKVQTSTWLKCSICDHQGDIFSQAVHGFSCRTMPDCSKIYNNVTS